MNPKILMILSDMTMELKQDNDSAESRQMRIQADIAEKRLKSLRQPLKSTINPSIFRRDKR